MPWFLLVLLMLVPLIKYQSTLNFWLFCIHPAVPAPDLPTHEKRKAAVANASCRLGQFMQD